jgi:hypothetical protein
MAYHSDDSGSSLKFSCRYQGPQSETFSVVLSFVSIIVFAVVVISIIVSNASELAPPGVGLIVLGLILAFPLLLFGIELLWQIAGTEVLEVSAHGVILRHLVFRHGPYLLLAADQIDQIFVSAHPLPRFSVGRGRYGFMNFKRGALAINCGTYRLFGGPRTFQFGTNLSSTEPEQINLIIRGRFPQYFPDREAA